MIYERDMYSREVRPVSIYANHTCPPHHCRGLRPGCVDRVGAPVSRPEQPPAQFRGPRRCAAWLLALVRDAWRLLNAGLFR